MPKPSSILIGGLSGHALPSDALKARLGSLYSEKKVTDVDKMIDDLVAVDAFARLLTEAMETCQTKDGRLDTKDVAAFVLRRMKESPR